MTFASPYVLFALLLVPLVAYVPLRRRPAGVRFSSIDQPLAVGRSFRQRFVWLPLILRLLALTLMIVALARPQAGMEKVYDQSHGIAIEMVVDHSSSMGEEMKLGSETLNRLEVVKRVFAEFINGNDSDLAGRPTDLVGMVAFAGFADTICPLTLAHGALDGFLDTIHLVDRKSEDGTAIGDALMLAEARLKTAEEELLKQNRENQAAKGSYTIKSKIIILLTDGMNNRGQYSPEQAAAQAKEWGIKIYTIGVGSEKGGTLTMPGFFGLQLPQGPTIDKAMLENLAATTGGIARLAEDEKSLREIYAEIDQLEKSEVESIRYIDYKELFGRFALAALLLLTLEFILSCTLLRKIP